MTRIDTLAASGGMELVTMRLAGQLFGIPVGHVHDVLSAQKMTRVPLAPESVAGALNLRGRIVTVLDLRVALGLGQADPDKAMNVVIAHQKEVYALLVDQVGDVINVPAASLEPPPHTLSPGWRSITSGIVRLEDDLLLMLMPERLLSMVVGDQVGAHA